MPIGNRVGTLEGLVVYKLSKSAWNLAHTKDDECLYWVGDGLWYHDKRVGTVTPLGGVNWNREEFLLLKRVYESSSYDEPAEVSPPSCEESCSVEELEPPTAMGHNTELVDATLRKAEWSVKDLLKSCTLPADKYLESVKEA